MLAEPQVKPLVLTVSKKQTETWLLVLGALGILLLFMLPRLILGENSYVTIHDNLDSELVWRMIMTEGGKLIGDTAATPRIMNGFPARLFPSQLNVTVWLFLFLSPFKAYVVNELLVHLVAYVGMFLLLKHHVLSSTKYKWIVAGVAFAFASLPFFSIYGISIAGQPLLLFAFLNLNKNSGKPTDYLIILLYAFYSSLPLVGFFVIAALVAWQIVHFYRFRNVSVQVLGGFVMLIMAYTVAEHNLIYTMLLDPDYVSHRTSFSSNYRSIHDIKSIVEMAATRFVFGHYHAVSVHRPVFIAIIMALIVAWKRRAYSQYGLIVTFTAVAFIFSCWYPIYHSYLLEGIKEKVQLVNTFDLSRFNWFHPLLWFLLLAMSLKVILDYHRWGKVMASILLVLQLGFCLGSTTEAHNEFRVNTELILAKHSDFNSNLLQHNLTLSYKEFYSEKLFDEVKAYLNRPMQDFRVASVGMHPSIAQYNGFYTLDGYQNNYPLDYKLKFREIIEEELSKAAYLQNDYDRWGNRFYLFVSELSDKYGNIKSAQVEVNNLELNTTAFRNLGGEYILSAVKINNYKQNRLKLENIFEQADSPWRVYLYKVE